MAASTSSPTIRTVLGALADHPSATAAELAAATKLGRSTVSKALAQLEADKLVTRETQGWDGARRLADRWTLLSDDGSSAPHDQSDPDRPAQHPNASPPEPAGEPGTPTIPDHQPDPGSGRLRKGELRELVLTYLQGRPGEQHSPTAVAKALGRSAGAVSNALVKLTLDGTVTQTSTTPRRFAYPADTS